MSPNFLVIGAMKCATTSLCDIFAAHPQMFMSAPKEPDFFCDDSVFQRGWDWYESLFEGAEDRFAVGEGSTGYTKGRLHPHATERIAKHLPEAKLIYIVRHPLHRIESHWLHLIACGEEVPPLRGALQRWPHILDTSLYWKQISAYRHHFPDQRILVLFFEDFVKHPEEIIRRCCKFLDVNPKVAKSDPSKASNVSSAMRLDTPIVRALKKIPLGSVVKNLTPGLALRVTDQFRRSLPGRPEWPEDLRREVIRQISDDAQEFLNFYGKSRDYWCF